MSKKPTTTNTSINKQNIVPSRYSTIKLSSCQAIFNIGIKSDEDYTRQDFLADCMDNDIKDTTAAAYWLKVGGNRHGSYNWKERAQS